MASRKLTRLFGSIRTANPERSRKRRTFRLDAIESLESRLVPATYVWTGAASSIWTPPATAGSSNWDIETTGVGGATFTASTLAPGLLDNAVFDNEVTVTNSITSLGGAVTVNSILFNYNSPISIDNAGPLTIVGDPAQNGGVFADGGSVDSLDLQASPVSIAAAIMVGNPGGNIAQTWASNVSLTASGVITYSNALTLAGSGVFDLTSATAAGTAGGSLTLNGAVLQLDSPNAIGPASLPLTLLGGTLSSDSSSVNLAIANPLTIGSTVHLGDSNNPGSITFSNASQTITNSPIIVLNGGNVAFTNAPLSLMGSPTFFNFFPSGGPTLTLSGGINTNGGNDTLTFNTGTANVSLSGNVVSGGSLPPRRLRNRRHHRGRHPRRQSHRFSPSSSNSTTGGEFQFTSTAVMTGTTLTAGTLSLNTSNVGSLTLNGGTLLFTVPRPVAPTVQPSTAASPSSLPGTGGVTFNNSQPITNSNVVLTFTGNKAITAIGTFTVAAPGFSIVTASAGGFLLGSTSPVLPSNFTIGANDISVANNGSGGFGLTAQNTLTFSGARTISLTGTGSSPIGGTLIGSLDAGGTSPCSSSAAPARLPSMRSPFPSRRPPSPASPSTARRRPSLPPPTLSPAASRCRGERLPSARPRPAPVP